MLRRAWGRLIRKQWLIFYPLALAVIDTMAFLAVFASNGETLSWSQFFAANFNRWQYVHDHFLASFSFTPALGVAVFAGVAVCVFAAMIRAPYFRAIAGPGYPLAPRDWSEAARLSLFYLFSNVVLWLLPLTAASNAALAQLASLAVLVVAILVAFADYAIVFEELGFIAGLRRSVRLLSRRWVPVVIIFVVVQLLYGGIYALYDLYYEKATGLFLLVPLSQILVQSIIVLLVDLLLILLYEQTRQDMTL